MVADVFVGSTAREVVEELAIGCWVDKVAKVREVPIAEVGVTDEVIVVPGEFWVG